MGHSEKAPRFGCRKSSMSQSYDIVIAGAGPAGSSLAILLAKTDRRVLVIDAAEFPRQKVCGEYLGDAAWPALARLGLEQRIRQSAVPLSHRELVLPNGRNVELPFSSNLQSRPACLSRYELDWLLVQEAQRHGATFLPAHRVRDVIIENGAAAGVLAQPIDNHAARLELRAPLIVAADGRRSSIVQRTGKITTRRGPELVGFKRHFRMPEGDTVQPQTISMYSLPGGYLGICPVEGGAMNVCGMIPRLLLQQARGSIEMALDRWYGRHRALARLLRSLEPLGPWSTMPEVTLQTARPAIGGVLYIGDACGTIEPLTGQGMTMALHSAILAADALQEATADRSTQDRYQARWQSQFGRQIRIARAIGWLLRHPRTLSTLLPPGLAHGAAVQRLVTGAYNIACVSPALSSA